MDFTRPRSLGSTGLKVGALGLASSYGAPAEAFEEAFERGCNYFVWNTFIKGRSPRMRNAIRNLVKAGKRDQMVIAVHAYAHNSLMNGRNIRQSMKLLGVDYIDVMLLGYYSWKPGSLVLSGTRKLKEKGLVKNIGMTGHSRVVIAELVKEEVLDLYHIRYNAVHTGAENDIFPFLKKENKPGIVSFTATRWGQLLDPKKMPEGEEPLMASDCYRFVLSNPHVDVCLTAPKTVEQMRENLKTLETGPLNSNEMDRIRKIGKYIYDKK